MRTRLLTLLIVLFSVALVAAGCSDDGDDGGDDDGITIGDDDSGDDDDGGDDDGGGDDDDAGDDDDDAGGSGGSGDLQVVWPLPDGGWEVWLPYQLIDDEFQYSESASFRAMGVSMDDVLDFYRDYFPTIDLVPDELALGESIALNLTNPADALWTGVMQVGTDPEGYTTVNQNYTDPKDQPDDPTTTEPGASSESDGSGIVSEGDG